MKICFLGPTRSIHFRRTVGWFVKRGHDVYSISHDPEKVSGANNIQTKARKFWPIKIIQTYFFLNKKLKEINPDVVHSDYGISFFSLMFSLLKNKLKIPFVLTLWGGDVLKEQQSFLLRPLLKTILMQTIKKADFVRAVSPQLKKNIQKKYRTKVIVLPRGVDTNLFTPNKSSKFNPKNVRIINIRRLDPIYNVDCLIKAMPKVIKKLGQKTITLKTIEEGSNREEILDLIKQNNLQGNVKLIAPVKHKGVVELMHETDIFITTSLSDGAPVSLMEALSCGIFPIASNIKANKNFVRHKKNGLLYKRKNQEDLANKIIYAIKNPTLISKAARLNRIYAKKNLDFDRIMNKMEQKLICLIERNKETK